MNTEMTHVDKYKLLHEIEYISDELSLYKVEGTNEEPFEMLIISTKNSKEEINKKNGNILKGIDALNTKQLDGIQKTIDNGFDEENEVYYVLYESCDKYFPIKEIPEAKDSNHYFKKTFRAFINGWEELSNVETIINENTVIIYDDSDSLKIRYCGLFKLFSLLETSYLPDGETYNKKDRAIHHAIHDIGVLFKEYLSSSDEKRKIYDKCVSKKYKGVGRFRNDITDLPYEENKNIPTVYIKVKPESNGEILNKFIKEMNNNCFIYVEPTKSNKDAYFGFMHSENYSSRYFIDDKEGYLFLSSNTGYAKTVSYDKKHLPVHFNFKLYNKGTAHGDVPEYFKNEYDKKNLSSENYTKTRHALEVAKLIPQAIIDTHFALSLQYTSYDIPQNKPTEISFTLKRKWNVAEAEKIIQKNINLYIGDKIIGKCSDYRDKDRIIKISDFKPININMSGTLTIDEKQNTSSQAQKQIKALERIHSGDVHNANISKTLFTPEDIDTGNFEYLREAYEKLISDETKNELNESQYNALLMACSVNDIMLIKGPPGTGKTKVISEIVRLHLKRNKSARILITSGTNAAIDNALTKIKNTIPDVSIVRLANSEMLKDKISEEMQKHHLSLKIDYWADDVQKKSKANFERISDNDVYTKVFHQYLIEKDKKPEEQTWKLILSQKKRRMFDVEPDKLDKVFKSVVNPKMFKLLKILKDWLSFIAKKDLSKINVGGNMELTLTEAYLKKSVIIGSTPIHANSKQYKGFNYDMVIMDEASMVEPEMVATVMTNTKKLILIGDENQLQPSTIFDSTNGKDNVKARIHEMINEKNLDANAEDVVSEDTQSQFEMSSTLFREHLPNHICMLDTQYRMSKHVGKMVSKYFYDGMLKNPDIAGYDELKDHKLKLKIPKVEIDGETYSNSIIFVNSGVKSDTREHTTYYGKPSYGNNYEVETILRTLETLNREYQNNIQEVGIISGYKGQTFLLRDKIKSEQYENLSIEIATVDSFQGSEKDIIIFNIVRNNSKGTLGHVSNENRVNVAISRMKKLLIFVGNYDFMMEILDIQEKADYSDKLLEIVKDIGDLECVYNSFEEALQ